MVATLAPHVERLLSELKGVKQRGSGWSALCPAHHDRNPSLDIDLGDDGRILLICRSHGCSAEQIVAAVGLEISDLFSGVGRNGSVPPWRRTTSLSNGMVQQEEQPTVDWPALAKTYSDAITDEQVQHLADRLGVTPQSLRDLGVGYEVLPVGEDNHGSQVSLGYTFPMYGADGAICGIRKRPLRGTGKHCVKGSKLGIFRTVKPGVGLLLICEGESDTAAALSLGFNAIGVPGAGQITSIVAAVARGLDVVLVADNDKAGTIGAEKLRVKLRKVVASLRTIAPPAKYKDLREWLLAGATQADVQQLIDGAAADPVMAAAAEATASDDGRQELVFHKVQGDVPLHQIVPQAVELLAKHARDTVYVHADGLAHVVEADGDGEGTSSRRIKRNQAPRVLTLPSAILRERLDSVARWMEHKETKQGVTVQECWAPREVVEAVINRGEWPGIRLLQGVTTAPVLRADGSILDLPGYDEVSQLLYAPRRDYPRIPQEPSAGEVNEALDTIMKPFEDFPFVSPEDRAAVLAFMLTIAGRPAIDGPVPMTAAIAHAAGSGKTLFIEAATTAMTGFGPDKLMVPGGRASDGDAEWRKRIATLCMEAPRVVTIDNLPDGGTLQVPALAAALSSDILTERLLGTNRSVRVAHRAVWALSGNNITLAADLARRSLSVFLDAGVEDPHLRSGFRISNLMRHVSDHHPSLLTAALTILRGFVVAGRPQHGGAQLGMFESWDELIRSCVIWGIGQDPLVTQERLRGQSPETAGLAAVLLAWYAEFGERLVQAAELLRNPAVADALAEACPAKGREVPTASAVGRWLGRYCGRVARGLRIDRCGAPNGKVQWALRKIGGGS